ncbi:NUT member 2G [Saguinus oedipus]|uniref:NUT member 2G n=1 Tax=Saguinus oedipus TaxID=9490 RepID=A0ABQ9WE58_SAGOE|nr:NUT member 2G [Saguinus oedipus]
MPSAGTGCDREPWCLHASVHGSVLHHTSPSPAQGPPLVTAVVPPGGPPVLSAFPRMPLVAGKDGRGPNWAGASNVLVQMGTEVGPVKAPQAQTLVLTQDPLIWQVPGTLCEGVACPLPQPLAAAPVVPAMAAQVFGGTQACEGGWPQGLPPPAPPAPQPDPMMAPGNAFPWPQGSHRKGSQAPSQAKAQPDDSCNPESLYENFQLWQHYKSLARRHLPQSPDSEALSCFFMFLDFEAEEEMQIQKSQWMKGPQCLPPPALLRLEPQGPLAPEVVRQPVYLPSKAGPKALPACLTPPRPQPAAETKADLLPPRPQQPVETNTH